MTADAFDAFNGYDIEEKCKSYIARPNTWYREGTNCRLIIQLHEHRGKLYGQFEGTYIIGRPENSIYDECFWLHIGYHKGDEVVMKSICPYDDFEITE